MRLPVPRSLFLLALTFCPTVIYAADVGPRSRTPALWPEPSTLSFGSTVLWLDEDVVVEYVRSGEGAGNGGEKGVNKGHAENEGGEDGCVCQDGECGCGCRCEAGIDGGGVSEDGNGDVGTGIGAGVEVDVDVDDESEDEGVIAPLGSGSSSSSETTSASADDSVELSTVTVTATEWELELTTVTVTVTSNISTTAAMTTSVPTSALTSAPIRVHTVSLASLPDSEPAATAGEEENEEKDKAMEKEKGKERETYDTHIGRNRHGYGVRRIKGRPRPGAVPLSVPVAIKKRNAVNDDGVDMKSAILPERPEKDRRVRRGGDYDRGHRHGRPQSRNKEADDEARPAAAVPTDQVPIKGEHVSHGGDLDRGQRHGRLQNRDEKTDDGARPAAVVTMDQEKLESYHFNFKDSAKKAIRDKFRKFVNWIRKIFKKRPNWQRGVNPMGSSTSGDPTPMRALKSDRKGDDAKGAWWSASGDQTPLRAMQSDLKRDDSKGVWSWIWNHRTVKPAISDEEENEPSVEQIIYSAIARAKQQMLHTKFIPWKFYPRHTVFEPDVSEKSESNAIRKITIIEDSNAYDNIRDYIDGDESYRIAISETGEIEILTSSRIGTLRALQTLPQLFYAHSSGSVYMPFAPVYLADDSKWKHRGLNLDIARNAFWPDDVKRTIDAMASVKLNRLHVHATDSQSWPIEIPSIPELSAKGAYCAGCVWTVEEVRDVQIYGLERGVSVFLEIDMPGHTASIGHAFPELVAAFEHRRWEKYAQEPPSGQIRLNNTDVDDFLDRLLDDIVPRVAPFTKYFHTGGDEFNTNAYLLDPNVESNDPAVLTPLVQKVVQRVHGKIRQASLTPIVWEEMALDWNLTFAEPPIVQTWRDTLAVKDLLKRGHRVIFGASDAWYLDCGVGGFFNPRENINVSTSESASISTINLNVHGNETEPDTIKATVMDTRAQDPFLDWCSPVKNWRHMYVHNPVKGISEDLAVNVEGGEAHMWTEMVDGVSLDGMVWPRAAAVAEVLWSGPRMVKSSGQWDEGVKLRDATRRLGEWRERAVLDLGIRASVVSMVWCLMGGNCDV